MDEHNQEVPHIIQLLRSEIDPLGDIDITQNDQDTENQEVPHIIQLLRSEKDTDVTQNDPDPAHIAESSELQSQNDLTSFLNYLPPPLQHQENLEAALDHLAQSVHLNSQSHESQMSVNSLPDHSNADMSGGGNSQPMRNVIQRKMFNNIEFIKELPDSFEDESLFPPEQKHLIILDDVIFLASEHPKVVRIFTQYRHHRNMSVIILTQNIFHQGKLSCAISLNSNYLVLFQNPRDKLQMNILAQQMFPSIKH